MEIFCGNWKANNEDVTGKEDLLKLLDRQEHLQDYKDGFYMNVIKEGDGLFELSGTLGENVKYCEKYNFNKGIVDVFLPDETLQMDAKMEGGVLTVTGKYLGHESRSQIYFEGDKLLFVTNKGGVLMTTRLSRINKK